jgi:hypothetical protein
MFGSPRMATLSVGGNDVDFVGIIFNCILEWALPFGGLNGIPAWRPCDEQKAITWMRLRDPKLIDVIDQTIKKIVEKARTGPVGHDFKLCM